MNIRSSSITGIILAGGQSRRMGQDKAWLSYDGQPFIQHIIQALKPLVSNVIIVANTDAYDLLNVPVLPDIIENCGPLGGIHTGLLHSQTPYNLVLSCDIPLMTTAALTYLLKQHNGALISVFSIADRWQPLAGLYHKDALNSIEEALAKKELRLMDLLKTCAANIVPCPSALVHHLSNINTPEDFEQLLK